MNSTENWYMQRQALPSHDTVTQVIWSCEIRVWVEPHTWVFVNWTNKQSLSVERTSGYHTVPLVGVLSSQTTDSLILLKLWLTQNEFVEFTLLVFLLGHLNYSTETCQKLLNL